MQYSKGNKNCIIIKLPSSKLVKSFSYDGFTEKNKPSQIVTVQQILLLYSMNKNTFAPLLILLSTALFMFACDKGGEENPDLLNIEYTLGSQEDGTVADISYVSGFGLIKLEDVALPWSISFKAIFENGDALSLKAESADQAQMSAQILLDDEVVASESATHLVQISYIKGFK